jgi:uncharacterized integral membrane protein
MRLIKALIALLFVALGVLFGALNRTPVHVDLGFAALDAVNLGTVLLVAMLVGALLAGLVLTATVVWPLRARLRRSLPGNDPPAAATHD